MRDRPAGSDGFNSRIVLGSSFRIELIVETLLLPSKGSWPVATW